MKEIKAVIVDQVGLHARPASLLVAVASKFESDVTITTGNKSGNLKSIMNVMALGVKKNDSVTIQATGADEEATIKAIEKTMKDNNLI